MQLRPPGAGAARAMFDRRPRRRAVAVGAAATASAVCLSLLGVAPAQAADVTHTIAQVQGTSATQGPGGVSPLAGQTVTVEGIVTGDHRTGGYRGLYVQTAGSGGSTDATPGASDGIFVFLASNTAPGVAIGDKVKVTGRVSEFNTVTQITATAAGSVELVQAGVGVPAVTPLREHRAGQRARAFEGMLVRPSGTYKLVSSHNLQNFGELWTSAGSTMPVEAFETQAPGTTAASDITDRATTTPACCSTTATASGVDNAAHPGDQPYFTKDTVVRNGDVVTFPAGGSLLSFDFGNWRLQPPTPLNDASAANLKPTFTRRANTAPGHALPPSAATSRSARSTC